MVNKKTSQGSSSQNSKFSAKSSRFTKKIKNFCPKNGDGTGGTFVEPSAESKRGAHGGQVLRRRQGILFMNIRFGRKLLRQNFIRKFPSII
jgi:hypothetical protein